MRYLFFILISICLSSAIAQTDSQDGFVKFGLLKYSGGGDWYANPTALPNLASFCNEHLKTKVNPMYETIEVGAVDIFDYAYIHMTGHGNVVFSDLDAQNLRLYLQSGGFLHIDDNYGMDPFVRVAMKKVFPELEFVELPFSHEIYHQRFQFKEGLPKIHKHDNKPPQGLALIWEGRVVCFYTFECDLGDGWEDAEVHNDPSSVRRLALEMGANIIQYAFEN